MSAVIVAVAGGRGLLVPGITVAFPGETLRMASAPYSSVTGLHYKPKVLSFGAISYRRSDRGGRTSTVETQVTIDDTDRTIARLYAGVYAGTLEGSAATIQLMTPTIASSSWLTVLAGVVTRISFPTQFVAELTVRANDAQLTRKRGWAITRQNWPNAAADAYGKIAPTFYGTHNSATFQTHPGMIPTIYIDVLAFRYLVCGGKAKSITRVFVDGVQTPTGWAVEYITRAGRIYTCVTFTTDQGDAVITVDGVGYEDVGDGSGTAISDPLTIWAHWISNFVLGDYLSGAWFANNALLDSTSLTATSAIIATIGDIGAPYSAVPFTGEDITAKLCTTYKLRTWWTPAGLLAIGKDDPHVADVYGGTHWKYYREEVAPFAFRDEEFNRKSRILARSAFSASQGSYLQSLEVVNAAATTELSDSIDMPWSACS